MTRDHIITAPLATLLLPYPVQPGRHARQQLGNVDRFSFHHGDDL